ncbi:hypothetical protein MRX96_039356 [Rhipicephalus microplus]
MCAAESRTSTTSWMKGVFVEEVLVVAGDLESPLRRSLLLNDKWRRLFDKFDPEGFGEIPWSDFLRALETPEFCQAVGPAKREILTAKAHRSHTSAITFDDFVAVAPSALLPPPTSSAIRTAPARLHRRRQLALSLLLQDGAAAASLLLAAARPKSARRQQLTAAAARIAKMDEAGGDRCTDGVAVAAYPPQSFQLRLS